LRGIAARSGIVQDSAAATPDGKSDFMALVEIYSQDFIRISHDPATSILHVDWIGYQSEDSVKQGCREILASMVRHGCYHVLNDNSNVKGIWTFATQWVGAEWLPKMKSAGLRKFAWIYSPAKLSQVSTDESLSHLPSDDIPVRTFYDVEESLAWLRLASDNQASYQQPAKR
jgi:hypothetical protein